MRTQDGEPQSRAVLDYAVPGERRPPLAGRRTPPTARRTSALLVTGSSLAVVFAVAWWALARGAATASTTRVLLPPVPVLIGVVETGDVPIYLDGLGTVQAFNTVTLRSRVDGQLVKVAFTEGQDVKAGDVLAQIDPAPFQATLDQAAAKRAQDEAQLANVRADLKRYGDLLATDNTTRQTYDTQKALVAQFEAAVKADQAAMDSARVNLDYTTIRSPIDGRVGIRQVDQGNIIHASDATGIVTLAQLRPISVVFTLPEQTLPKLQPTQPAPDFVVTAVSRDNTHLLAQGRLAVIDNQIDTTTGTIKLKASFANDDLRLWPGQFVNTRLLLTTRTNGVVVPASVVQRGPDGAFAFVVQDDHSVKMRSLKIAQIEGGVALIDDGLKPGERVVVDGQYKLQPGSKVKAVESPENRERRGNNPGDRIIKPSVKPQARIGPDPIERGYADGGRGSSLSA